MRIFKENTSLLVIDMQERLVPVMAEKELLVNNCITLIKGIKTLEMPLLYTQQYSKGLGETIPSVSALFEGIPVIEKSSFSCCDEDMFLSGFKALERNVVIICGIETHVCVMQTAVDMLDNGFLPVIVENCTTSRNLNDKAIAIRRLMQEGAIITTYESILFELCRYSGSAEFKAISALVK